MKILSFLLVIAAFTACSSIYLPTVEQSRARIDRLGGVLRRAESPLIRYEQRMASERDISTAIKLSVLNTVLGALASQRSYDLIVVFPPTRPLLE